MTDDELMKLAKKRVKSKIELKWHLISYLLVNTFLVLVCFISGSSYFWPIWPILGWGLGLAFHAVTVHIELSQGLLSKKIEEEYNFLKTSPEFSNDYLEEECRQTKN